MKNDWCARGRRAPIVETMEKTADQSEPAILSAFSVPEAWPYGGGKPGERHLLDVKMPGMDGNGNAPQIKESHPSVEVIISQGHATMGRLSRG